MKILGIETSCDETAVSLLEAEGDFPRGEPGQASVEAFRYKVLGNALSSQAAQHAKYGGVVPNLAKGEHQKNLVPMLEIALKEAGELSRGAVQEADIKRILEREPVLYERLSAFLATYAKPDVDCIAVTAGPGLEPCLWVGINFAKALSLVWNVPIIAVNHMEGHIVMSMVEKNGLASFRFPVVSLLISGGHTDLIVSRTFGSYEYAGRTRDDAVGEAFDKVARMLGLPYPGGPHISRLAEEARENALPRDILLPRPMLQEDNSDFSFAGLKTAVLRTVTRHSPLTEHMKKQIAREFEDAAADVLVGKTLRAVKNAQADTVIVGGGVSANKHIRAELDRALSNEHCTLLICPPEFSTDNAVMIALAGYFHALKKEFVTADTLVANGALKLGM